MVNAESFPKNLLGKDPSFWDESHFSSPWAHVGQYPNSDEDQRLASALADVLRKRSVGKGGLAALQMAFMASSLPKTWHRIFLVLYSPGKKRIVVSRSGDDEHWNFSRCFARILKHERAEELLSSQFFLQIEFANEPPVAVDYYKVGMKKAGDLHFEIGVDGLVIEEASGNKTHFFLPGDAYVRSVLTMQQLREYLSRVHGDEKLRAASFRRFRSTSFMLNGSSENLMRMYRGLPQREGFGQDELRKSVELAIEHVQGQQRSDGSFLYYYDAARDSLWDHEHPKRDPKKNPYYNILRHSGGGLTYLYYEKFAGTGKTLDNVRAAIEYLEKHAEYYEVDGRRAAYIYSERKAKLGGAGIGLYMLSEYYLLTGDRQYQDFADALAWHIFHQITESGEFIYYNIYLDKPITAAENHDYFSFYYPGEAVCGLARYLQTIEEGGRGQYFERLHRALEFLIVQRPIERADKYTEVPSDAWLMMGIMELWDFPEMRKSLYSDFVFSDARIMIEQMYKVDDSPYPDYAGAFYYQFNDFPYADGARLEGMLGAYELAKKMELPEHMNALWTAMQLGAWSVRHLVNDEDAIYAVRNAGTSLGGIRFKYTRQWFRIDTIQHVASFYAKMLPYYGSESNQG